MSVDRPTLGRRTTLIGSLALGAAVALSACSGNGNESASPTPSVTQNPGRALATAVLGFPDGQKTSTPGPKETPTIIPFTRQDALNTLRTVDGPLNLYVGPQFAPKPTDYAALTDQQIATQSNGISKRQIDGQNILEGFYRTGPDGTQLYDVKILLGYDGKPYETTITANLRPNVLPDNLKQLFSLDPARSTLKPDQLQNAAQAIFNLPKDVQFIWKNGSTPVEGKTSEPALIGVGIDSAGRIFEVFISLSGAAQLRITEPSRPAPVIPR